MRYETLPMTEILEHGNSTEGTRWFSPDSCVESKGDLHRVLVGGYLIGEFKTGDTTNRNLILIAISKESRFSKIAIAAAFGISDERLLQIRRQAEKSGVESVLLPSTRGRRPKVTETTRDVLNELFAQGHCPHQAFVQHGKEAGISYRTVRRVHEQWVNHSTSSSSDTQNAQAVQQSLELPGVSAFSAEREAKSESDAAAKNEAEPQDSNGVIPEATPQSERHVLNAGCLLLIAMVFSLGLHEAVLSGWETTIAKQARLRAVLDAIIAALGIGQKSVEGVRRLEHPSGKALLRAPRVPSESGTRLLLKEYLADVGSSDAHFKMTHCYLERSRLEDDAPAVFYVDNHILPYTGKRKLQKGWRMQDKRVRPGTCDYWVHDEDGRPLFRVDVPMHGTLGDWLTPIAKLFREKLGDEQRILLAFDRGGAFPKHLAPLCEEGFEFVTYERAPYDEKPKNAFVATLELEDETLLAYEEQVRLGDSEIQARRIGLLTDDERQVNVISNSSLPLARLVEIITGRWVQEYSFKHGNERWGTNQLDCRKTAKYAPNHIIVNPVHKRLERALLISREREGTARRRLARAKRADKRAALKSEIKELVAQQKELETERKITQKYALLKDTELSDKLVYIDTHYKTLLDTILIACINAESELAELIRPHLAKSKQAKMVLQNIFKSKGHIRVHNDRIDLTLELIGNQDERRAAKPFAIALNRLQLCLPGDSCARPLHCRLQF